MLMHGESVRSERCVILFQWLNTSLFTYTKHVLQKLSATITNVSNTPNSSKAILQHQISETSLKILVTIPVFVSVKSCLCKIQGLYSQLLELRLWVYIYL